jgi:hypothetical protein
VFFEVSYGRALFDPRARRELFGQTQVVVYLYLYESFFSPDANFIQHYKVNKPHVVVSQSL